MKHTPSFFTARNICLVVLSVLCLTCAKEVFAAMPVLNANPFTQAQNALKTLIENAVTLGKWLAMACMVVCFLASLTDRFKKETCIRLAIIMAAFSGLGWIVELFMGAM